MSDREEVLRADTGREIRGVLACHDETSTGVTNDIGAPRAVMDACNHPAMLFVDAVSSLGSIEVFQASCDTAPVRLVPRPNIAGVAELPLAGTIDRHCAA